MNIRDYTPADLGFALERHKNMYRDEYGLNDIFYDYAEKGIVEFFAKARQDGENIWIAEEDGRPVGMIAVVSAGDGVCQLRWFLVDASGRGSGTGTRLMETALAAARGWGYKTAFLGTSSNLSDALRLYARFGFAETERTANTEWTDGLIYEIRMEKTL